MINSDGFAVSFGCGLNGGDLNLSSTQIYYCGRKLNQCRCNNCDGRCGPTDGCPCNSCKELTLSNREHINYEIKCPRGHVMKLSNRETQWRCDGRNEPDGCAGNRRNQSASSRWRCSEGCDFDYCGACYTKKLPRLVVSSNIRINCEGVKSIPSYDWFHTGSERHYCGRNVGNSKYANDCQICSGRCGPTHGCQCIACFKIDNPEFISNSVFLPPQLTQRSVNNPKITSDVCKLIETNEEIQIYHYYYHHKGDIYVGQMINNQRHGCGTYSYCISGKNTSLPHYIEFKGEWEHNQLIKYLSYENIWWKCIISPSCNLPSIPILEDTSSSSSDPNFDTNIFKTIEFLIIDNSFYTKYSNKMTLCQNFVHNKNERTVTGLWTKLSISFTLHFSEDFSLIESGHILHIPSNTVIMTFGKVKINEEISSTESNQFIDNTLLAEYHPDQVQSNLFQSNLI